MRADARHALAEAEHTVASNTAERARRAAAITAAEGDLAVIERATAPHRELLAIDAKRADQARLSHADAERRLAGSGRRGRREARRELDIAERVLDRATAILERTRQRTAPDVERYQVAVTNVEEARTDLRHHDLATRLDPLTVGSPTWRGPWPPSTRGSGGPTATPSPSSELHDTVEILTAASGTEHGEQHRALGHAIQTWAETAGVDLHLTDPRAPTMQPTGIELEL